MCSRQIRRFVQVVALACVVSFGFVAEAQKLKAGNRALKKTYLATEVAASSLSPMFTDAFDPTTISCPGTGTCTVRVEVSAILRGYCCGHAVYGQVLVDDVAAAPGSEISIDGTTSADTENVAATAVTFAWVHTGILPGTHTVEVKFRASATAETTHRFLTIGVYKP